MKTVLILIIAFCSTTLSAQSILDIRKHYQEVTKEINLCGKTSDNCSLYLNTLNINEGDQPWRAVGNYSKNVNFWYTDDPTHCDECGEKGLSTLLKVVVNEAGSTYTALKEFLYKDGELIFCYQKREDETGLEEHRYYFNNYSLIRYQFNDKIQESEAVSNGQIKRVLEKSKNYQSVFLNSLLKR